MEVITVAPSRRARAGGSDHQRKDQPSAARSASAWRRLARHLLCWAKASGRDTPWRGAPNPYKLSVAEILLQKTKGGDAEPVWREMVAAYPDACALADADDSEVLALVAHLGLGQQRTQRLKQMARALCGGEQTGKLPGLGPYGSAILALSAGGTPLSPPVDGNVARVVCRLNGLSFTRGEPRRKPEVKNAVEALLKTQGSADQKLRAAYALVDLGATICIPGRPNCAACPLAAWCAFFASARRS